MTSYILTSILLISLAFAQGNSTEEGPYLTEKREQPAPKYPQRFQVIKTPFFSPVLGSYSLGYQRMVAENIGIEAQVGIISVNRYADVVAADKVRGAYGIIGAQYRVSQAPNNEQPLQGVFLMANLIYAQKEETIELSYYQQTFPGQAPQPVVEDDVYRTQSLGLLFGVSSQWVFSGRLFLQASSLIGYHTGIRKQTQGQILSGIFTDEREAYFLDGQYMYSHLNIGRAAVRITFNMGWAF